MRRCTAAPSSSRGRSPASRRRWKLLFQPSELRKWRPTNDFSCDVCRRGFSSRHRRDEHQELRRDYAGSCDDADRAHNFIIRYQAAHRIDFNGAREACYEQWRRQGREL